MSSAEDISVDESLDKNSQEGKSHESSGKLLACSRIFIQGIIYQGSHRTAQCDANFPCLRCKFLLKSKNLRRIYVRISSLRSLRVYPRHLLK